MMRRCWGAPARRLFSSASGGSHGSGLAGFVQAANNNSHAGGPSGRLTFKDFVHYAKTGEIRTVVVAFTDVIGRTLGKRYDADYVVEAGENGFLSHACEYLLTVDADMNILPGFKAASWGTGYADFTLIPDYSTFCVASWLDHSAFLLCDIVDAKTHKLLPHAPRTVLRGQVEKAKELGFGANCASELEYFIFNDTYRNAARKGYTGLEPAGWVLEDYHILQGTRTEDFHSKFRYHLKKSGIPVETTKGEYGHGQHETNVKYADVMTMADRHIIYKQCAKELAERLGKSLTFMAKPHADQSGSSCHIHLNLTNASDGSNAFKGTKDFHSIVSSDNFRHFLGGWMKYTPEVMPFLAPTINSYKRYQAASWAPTRIAWSPDNRTTGFRIVGDGKTLRIECRIPGADANPYLAFAASLACGLEGIRQKIEPPAPFTGDSYSAQHLQTMPSNLKEATDMFRQSEFVRRAFGDEAVEHYAHFFDKEWQSFNAVVTDWERRRYFEQI